MGSTAASLSPESLGRIPAFCTMVRGVDTLKNDECGRIEIGR